MIINSSRVIFVHIQKTGGDALATALGQHPNCPEKHFFASELRELYGPDVWNLYFKFSFVRNPWDRLVSWWSMIDGRRAALAEETRLNNFHRFVLARARTFEEFLENCDEEIIDTDGRKWIYRNQLDYLLDSSGRQIVDFIGRFETIQSDFDAVTQRLFGKSIALPRLNVSMHDKYSDYYTAALANKVARRYERDISVFGYKFGQ